MDRRAALTAPVDDFPKDGWIAKLWREQEAYDDALHRHSRRVSTVGALVARELGWRDEDIVKMQLAGQFHDVGKLDIPRAILHAPRRLTPEERALIEKHSVFGRRRIRDLGETPVLGFVEDVALHHHERFDGTGYPDRLAGKAISEPSRIAMIADVYSALLERRTYKDSMSHADVLSRMTEGDERMTPAMFDPALLTALRGASPAIRAAVTA